MTEPLLIEILNASRQIVADSALRTVTRHSVGEKTFYVKKYFHNATTFGPMKYFFKIPASRAEWQLALPLRELGIAVVPHLAHGERWSWRGLQESILITAGPSGFIPLKFIDPSSLVQTALGKFLRRLHDGSVFHTDLHVSNLLYSPQANEFCLVDLDNMQILPSLEQRQRMDNLATLNRRWPLTSEFYQAYDAAYLNLADEIAECAERKSRASIPKKLKVLFDNRVLFRVKKFGGLKWHVRTHPEKEKLESILKQPDEFLASCAGVSGNEAENGFVLKRFPARSADYFRSTRARHAFRTARHLELLKIAAPLPVAMAERRCFGLIFQSYLVTEEIPQAVPLSQWPGDRCAAVERAAQLIAKLHSEGFTHRDLRETNILFRPNGQPYIIGLGEIRYTKNISLQSAAADLARLMHDSKGEFKKIPMKHRVIFLKKYSATREIENWRWWWSEIEKFALLKSSK